MGGEVDKQADGTNEQNVANSIDFVNVVQEWSPSPHAWYTGTARIPGVQAKDSSRSTGQLLSLYLPAHARQHCHLQARPVGYWNTPDPVLVEGTEEQRQRAFHQLAMELSTRIRLLLTLLEREKRAST
jgi:hypothetical protein